MSTKQKIFFRRAIELTNISRIFFKTSFFAPGEEYNADFFLKGLGKHRKKLTQSLVNFFYV